MNKIIYRKYPLLILTFCILVALFSFMIADSGKTHVAEANDENESRQQTAVQVFSVEEATKIAGFQVIAPDTNFDDELLEYRIDVMQLKIASNGPNSKPVGQNWTFADGSWIRLVELPGLGIPNTGETAVFDGVNTSRLYLEGDKDMPPRVGFYWHVGDIGYCLCGTITDSINEDVLITLIKSTISRSM